MENVLFYVPRFKIRVVLADDHQQMIAIVRQTLGEEFEVVGAVEDGKQAGHAWEVVLEQGKIREFAEANIQKVGSLEFPTSLED